MRIITLFSLAVLFMSCDCYIAQPTSIPVATPNRFLIIFNGESNSGGWGDNSDALAAELMPQKQIQILNNNTFALEDLDIGTNNSLDHYAMLPNKHGWELELANRVTAEPTYYGDTVWLCKTGQGASTVAQWADTTTVGSYFYKAKRRIRAQQFYLSGTTYKTVIFMSLGLNDLGGVFTNNDTFRVKMVTHINNLRTITGANTPVIMTKFFAPYTGYNNTIDSIAYSSGLSGVYTIDGSGASLMPDGVHWSYAGLKTITNRLITVLKTIYP